MTRRSLGAPANFNRLAGIYRWMEYGSFGPFLGLCRVAFLGELGQASRALVLGDGDGRFTQRLLATHSCLRVTAVDASAAMLEALMRRCVDNRERLTAIVADLRHWRPDSHPGAGIDLIATHFFLDCLTTREVEALVERLLPVLARRSLWVVSEFAIPSRGMARWAARLVVRGLYWAFARWTGLAVRELPEYRPALEQAGFVLRAERKRLRGLLVSQLWERG